MNRLLSFRGALDSSPSIFRLLAAIILVVTLGLGLTQLYQLGPDQWSLWFTAAIVHTIASLLVLIWQRNYRQNTGNDCRRSRVPLSVAYLCSFTPVLLAILWTVFFPRELEPQVQYNPRYILWITWIPVVEELFFRMGVTPFIYRYILKHRFWSAYFSVVLFSWIHSLPNWERLSAGSGGLVLGPFILGIFCELIYDSSGKILPAIFLHSSCNFAVLILQWSDLFFLP